MFFFLKKRGYQEVFCFVNSRDAKGMRYSLHRGSSKYVNTSSANFSLRVDINPNRLKR